MNDETEVSVSASVSLCITSPMELHYSEKCTFSVSLLSKYRGISMSRADMRLRHYAERCPQGHEIRLAHVQCFCEAQGGHEYWIDCYNEAEKPIACEACPDRFQKTAESAIRVHNRWVRTKSLSGSQSEEQLP